MVKIKVVAYCRVSTNSKDQKNSFQNQKDYFENVAKESKKYDLIEIYADEGISGVYLKKREEFLQMIWDAGINYTKTKKGYIFDEETGREPKFEKILIKDITRFSRNMDIIPLYRCLISKGVSLYLVSQGLELATEKDEFYLNLLLNFAQNESVDRGDKVRWGLKEVARKGIIRIARGLYGYHYDSETRKVTIVEEEAEIVKTIFDMYVNRNMGVRKIVKYLEEHNILTRDNKNFGYSSITRLIGNRKYCGDLIYLKYDSGTVLNKNTTHKIRPEEDWIIHKDKIPIIIPREMFDKAQELKDSRRTKLRGKKQAYTTYSRLLVCGNCGAFYGRNKANGTYHMNCMTKKKYGVAKCDYPNIKEDDLDQIIDTLTGEFYSRFISAKNIQVERLNELKQGLMNKVTSEIPQEYYDKQGELKIVEEQKKMILDLYLDKSFDKKTLDVKAEEIYNKIDNINSQLLNLSMPLTEAEKQTKEIDNRINELNGLQVKRNLNKEDIINLIGRIDITHIWDQLELKVWFKMGETINKALNTLNQKDEDLSTILEVPHVFYIKCANNVPIRVPKGIEVPEGTNLREYVKKREKRLDELEEKLSGLFTT